MEKVRLNKYIAHKGYCTRRQAADLIKQGKVVVDGKVADNPGLPVNDANEILIKGEVLAQYEEPEYWLLNKPKGFGDGNSEAKSIFGLIKKTKSKHLQVAHIMSDDNTGLHVFTNDRKLMDRLTSKAALVQSTYHIKLDQPIDRQMADKWEDAMGDMVKYIALLDDPYYDLATEGGALLEEALLAFIQKEGRQVLRLDRCHYSGLTKKDLPRGFARPLTEREVVFLKHFT